MKDDKEGRQIIKSSRWLLLRNRKNVKPTDRVKLNELLNATRRLECIIVDDASPVIIEDIHHQWKKDAPSGTALMLGERIAQERKGDDSAIDYRSVRTGEVIGVHTITFRMNGEEFDLVHRANDRSIYALGALDAGAWLTGQAPGLYSARDWLSAR